MFALRFKNSKKLLGFEMYPNRSVYGNEVKLTQFSNCLWVVRDRHIAEKVAKTSSSSYNSNFLCPVNNYVGQLEVVEFDAILKKQKGMV